MSVDNDKRLNEVIRVHKKPNSFVMIDRGFLENPNLSWKAKGILAYLLSKPDNWKVIVKDLVNHATDGKAAVYSGLGELKGQGHYQKTPVRDSVGRRISHWEGTVSEVPMEFPENTPSSLLTDFQEIENQDIENQDIENREHSNNYINKNYNLFSNNQSSPVGEAPQNGQDTDRTDDAEQKIKSLTWLIRENISYSDLALSRPHDMNLVDEFAAIILDVLMSEGGTVRIGNENKPRALVRAQLMKLNYSDIEHAIDQFNGVTERITKKKQYMLTMLYNCKLELDAHYTNQVNADFHGGAP